jgi:hypothetical protein
MDIHLLRDDIVLNHLTQNEYEDSLILKDGGSPKNMLCNIEQQGYNLRSKYVFQKENFSHQKDNPIVPAVQTDNKNPEKRQVQPAMILSTPKSDRLASPFSLENEISNIKILIPLNDLVKTISYRNHILKWLQPSSATDPSIDVINLQDEKPIIVLGPIVEEMDDYTPPFYVSFNVHDKILHNFLLDYGASHNIMPKFVMEELG